MTKTLDWKKIEAKAKDMSTDALLWSIQDCVQCVKAGVDQGYYSDEASVYRAELRKRGYASTL